MSMKGLPARAIYGYDSVNEQWVKVKVDEDGKINITNADVTTILEEIQSVTYGLEAIKDTVDGISVSGATAQEVWEYGTRALSTPADYKADVSALALEATLTAIKGAGWTDENIKEIVDLLEHNTYGLSALEALVDDVETRLTATRAGYLDELDFALAEYLEDLRQKATSPSWDQDTDSLEAISEAVATKAPANEYDTQLDQNLSTTESNITTAITSAHSTTDGKVDGLNDVSTAEVNTEVDNALDTAIPGSPTADSINERVATMDGTVATNLDTTISSRAPSGEYDTQLDANMSTRAPASEYDTEMARITADVATEAKQDVIDGYHDVPSQDSATNTQVRDVVGNKTDTSSGTSIVGLVKAVKAKTDNLPTDPADDSDIDTQLSTIDGLHDVPSEDSATDTNIRDVVGKKSDTVAGTSIIALLKQLIVDTGTDIVADFDRHITWFDCWSDPSAVVTITGGTTDVNLPDVTIPTLPTGATIWKVVLLFKCAKIKDSSGSDNAINGACNIQIKKSSGAWDTDDITAWNVQDNSWAVDVSEATEIGGDAFVGNINNDNLSGEVDAAATYNIRFDAIAADGANLLLHDVAVGLRVYIY